MKKVIYFDLLEKTENCTLSTVSVERSDGSRQFVAFCLEDAVRYVKVKGKSCIAPLGACFQIVPRFDGKTHARLKSKYNTPFALQLAQVANFQGVLLHEGETIKDTEGCPLIALEYAIDGKDFKLRNSKIGYLSLFAIVKKWIKDGIVPWACFCRENIDSPNNHAREVIEDWDYQTRNPKQSSELIELLKELKISIK
jgi:hypothetical protein